MATLPPQMGCKACCMHRHCSRCCTDVCSSSSMSSELALKTKTRPGPFLSTARLPQGPLTQLQQQKTPPRQPQASSTVQLARQASHLIRRNLVHGSGGDSQTDQMLTSVHGRRLSLGGLVVRRTSATLTHAGITSVLSATPSTAFVCLRQNSDGYEDDFPRHHSSSVRQKLCAYAGAAASI